MSTITVEIWDTGGIDLMVAAVPTDQPVERVLLALVKRLGLPLTNADGQLISYKLNHHNTNRQLIADMTLLEAGVNDGDILRIIREVLAG